MKANEAPEKLYIYKSQFWGLMANEHNITKDGIEYFRADAFIEKAKSWFIQQHTGMWNEFKKYMKGE